MAELSNEQSPVEREPYEIFDNPVVRQRYRLLERGTDEEGEFLRVEIRYHEGAKHFPEHVHPRIEKTLEVLSGEFVITLNGEEHVLTEGETLTVPAGVPHVYRTVGETDVLWEIRPPMAMEALFRTTSVLARAGKTDAEGTPNLLAMAVLLGTYPEMVYLTSPPIPVQKLLFRLLAPIGRLRGYKPDYPPSRARRAPDGDRN